MTAHFPTHTPNADFLSETETFLHTVNDDISALLKTDSPDGTSLWEASLFTCRAGGKRVRPRLVRYFANMLEIDDDIVRPIAVTAELIHAASLVHDDVIDEADTRRGKTTVHKKWNTLTAVLSGDFMFAIAFQNLHPLPHDVMTTAAAVLREMSCAVMDEFEARHTIVDLDLWRRVAEGKTGSLFAWCGLAPAIVGENDQAQKDFAAVGRHFGVAFQLADDIKDVLPNQGKDRFQDLINGNPSFLISMAVREKPELREQIFDLWKGQATSEQIEAVGHQIIEFGFPAAIDSLRKEIECGLYPLRNYQSDAASAFISWTEENLSAYLDVVSL